MNIDELWWTYRCLEELRVMSVVRPPNPAERACFSVWPPPAEVPPAFCAPLTRLYDLRKANA